MNGIITGKIEKSEGLIFKDKTFASLTSEETYLSYDTQNDYLKIIDIAGNISIIKILQIQRYESSFSTAVAVYEDDDIYNTVSFIISKYLNDSQLYLKLGSPVSLNTRLKSVSICTLE